MMAEPIAPLVTTPELLTLAIDGALVVHVPPPVALLKVVAVPPEQSKNPVAEVIGVPKPTVITVKDVQPVTV